VYSAWDCYGRSAADLHAMLPSLCVVIVRVFAIHVQLSVCLFNSFMRSSSIASTRRVERGLREYDVETSIDGL
jgi:hypothetical protein